MRRWWLLLGLASLFYFSRFPSLTITDLIILAAFAVGGILLTAHKLMELAGGLVDEALSDNKNSFISRHWARHRRYGFNRQMTQRVAQCLIDILCVKFGFDVVQVTLANVPATQGYERWADIASVALVVGIMLYWGVWLKWAVDFRAKERDRQSGRPIGSTRIGSGLFAQLYYKPVIAFVLALYAPEWFKLLLGTTVQGAVTVATYVFGAPDLMAAPASSNCAPGF